MIGFKKIKNILINESWTPPSLAYKMSPEHFSR